MFDFDALDEADAKLQENVPGFNIQEFDGTDTRLAGHVDISLLRRSEEDSTGFQSGPQPKAQRSFCSGSQWTSSTLAPPTSDSASARANFLVRRGHDAWRDLRYHDALADFIEGANVEAVEGPSSLSLLCLRFCLGVDLGPGLQCSAVQGGIFATRLFPMTLTPAAPEPPKACSSRPRAARSGDFRGHEACRAMAEGLSQLWCLCRERHARQLRILRPRKSMWEPDDHVQWAAEDIQIFDGSCTVGTGEDVAEVGYRLLMNRKPRATENTLLILYHGNGEVCEDYTDWADIYRVFPCSMLIFDYRGYGWSTGKPSMANLLSDAEQCMQNLPEILRQKGLSWPWPAPVLLLGRSLGSAVVTHLLGTMADKFDGLILDSGFATSGDERYDQLLTWLGDSREQAATMFKELSKALRASLPPGCKPGQADLRILGSVDLLRGFRGPVLVLHGEHDFIVPLEHARRHYDAAVHSSQRELVVLDADHNTLAGVPDFWKKQMAFAKCLVKKKEANVDQK